MYSTQPYQWTGELSGRTLSVYPKSYSTRSGSSSGGGKDDGDKDDDKKPKTPSTPAPKWSFQPNQFDQAPVYDFGSAAQWSMNPQLQPWMMSPVQTGQPPASPAYPQMDWLSGTPQWSISPAPQLPTPPAPTTPPPASTPSSSTYTDRLRSLITDWQSSGGTEKFDLSKIRGLLGQWTSKD